MMHFGAACVLRHFWGNRAEVPIYSIHGSCPAERWALHQIKASRATTIVWRDVLRSAIVVVEMSVFQSPGLYRTDVPKSDSVFNSDKVGLWTGPSLLLVNFIGINFSRFPSQADQDKSPLNGTRWVSFRKPLETTSNREGMSFPLRPDAVRRWVNER